MTDATVSGTSATPTCTLGVWGVGCVRTYSQYWCKLPPNRASNCARMACTSSTMVSSHMVCFLSVTMNTQQLQGRADARRLAVDGSTYDVQFDDWMFLMDRQVMLNRAAMSKFGFHLGDVTLSFHKP